MINYIRHDEEFHFIAKLVSGEQVIGKGFAMEEEGETLIYVSDPLEISIIIKNLDKNKSIKGIGLNKWMHFSEEDFYIIREKDIITIAGLSSELIAMYNLFWQKEIEGDTLDEKKVELDTEMGLIGKVDDMRSKLEKLFKDS
jgi:hypothetical protein